MGSGSVPGTSGVPSDPSRRERYSSGGEEVLTAPGTKTREKLSLGGGFVTRGRGVFGKKKSKKRLIRYVKRESLVEDGEGNSFARRVHGGRLWRTFFF